MIDVSAPGVWPNAAHDPQIITTRTENGIILAEITISPSERFRSYYRLLGPAQFDRISAEWQEKETLQ
ncbi:MAG: hypothetical protein ABI191_02090 [Rhizomicrobium sp.]